MAAPAWTGPGVGVGGTEVDVGGPEVDVGGTGLDVGVGNAVGAGTAVGVGTAVDVGSEVDVAAAVAGIAVAVAVAGWGVEVAVAAAVGGVGLGTAATVALAEETTRDSVDVGVAVEATATRGVAAGVVVGSESGAGVSLISPVEICSASLLHAAITMHATHRIMVSRNFCRTGESTREG